jgi:2,4-dienoyl-CoA reductase-like NADH-dependent reductase (Old Yellow Enzyme family)
MFLSNMIGTFHRFANRSDGLLCSADRPSVRKFRMSALFSPFMLRRLTLRNRIVVSPMCQYSAEGGEPNSWHLTHLGNLALSGAGMLCIEGTAVEPEGRITPGDLGLWDDRTEAAFQPVLAAVRKYSKIAVTIQLAHAGRKGSSRVPWEGGAQIPLTEGGWLTDAPSALAHKQDETKPSALDAVVGLSQEEGLATSPVGLPFRDFSRNYR